MCVVVFRRSCFQNPVPAHCCSALKQPFPHCRAYFYFYVLLLFCVFTIKLLRNAQIFGAPRPTLEQVKQRVRRSVVKWRGTIGKVRCRWEKGRTPFLAKLHRWCWMHQTFYSMATIDAQCCVKGNWDRERQKKLLFSSVRWFHCSVWCLFFRAQPSECMKTTNRLLLLRGICPGR